jgi:hypothetical protein
MEFYQDYPKMGDRVSLSYAALGAQNWALTSLDNFFLNVGTCVTAKIAWNILSKFFYLARNNRKRPLSIVRYLETIRGALMTTFSAA